MLYAGMQRLKPNFFQDVHRFCALLIGAINGPKHNWCKFSANGSTLTPVNILHLPNSLGKAMVNFYIVWIPKNVSFKHIQYSSLQNETAISISQ
jgi:hypothetical protein